MMNKIHLEAFHVVGISIKTTNENQQSAGDIGHLWERIWEEDIRSKIPGRINEDIYCVYTEYEGDFTQPYTTLIGYRTENPANITEGMKGITINRGEYLKLTAKGKLDEGIVIQEWNKVWQSDLNRTYKADFEVYGESTANPDNAEIDIFVGIQE